MPVSLVSCVISFARVMLPRAAVITEVLSSSKAALRYVAISASTSRCLEESHLVAFFIFVPSFIFLIQLLCFRDVSARGSAVSGRARDRRYPQPDESECVNQHADIRLALVRRTNGHAHKASVDEAAIDRRQSPGKCAGGLPPHCLLTNQFSYQGFITITGNEDTVLHPFHGVLPIDYRTVLGTLIQYLIHIKVHI